MPDSCTRDVDGDDVEGCEGCKSCVSDRDDNNRDTIWSMLIATLNDLLIVLEEMEFRYG